MTVQVLIAEDEPALAHELGFLVQSLGYDVIGLADTCSEAIALCEKIKPQIALIDVELKDGMAGLRLAGELEGRWGTKVVLVTADTRRLQTSETTGRLVSTKPIDDVALGALMRKAQVLLEAAQ